MVCIYNVTWCGSDYLGATVMTKDVRTGSTVDSRTFI